MILPIFSRWQAAKTSVMEFFGSYLLKSLCDSLGIALECPRTAREGAGGEESRSDRDSAAFRPTCTLQAAESRVFTECKKFL